MQRKFVTVLLLSLLLSGCYRPPPNPATLTYLRLGWAQRDEFPTAEPFAAQFAHETGIHLQSLPVPETSLDQLELSRKLLQRGSSGPDVLNIDAIWSGALEPDLLDLRAYLSPEIASLEPQLFQSYAVGEKLVAIPYQVQVGVLQYHPALLRRYGYDHPPRTWEELESMAERIQAGERARGKKDFWGYVWQGAASEGLTCNALEWQVAEGGGHILEADRTVSVNNRSTIRAWERAKRWIGWISPPSVLAFRESDSMNAFDSGRAAFNRFWGGTTITPAGYAHQVHWQNHLAEGEVGYSSMPEGSSSWAGTLGGSGLAISRHSAHRKEAIQLVQFLIRAEISSVKAKGADVYTHVDLEQSHDASKRGEERQNRVAVRPSTVAGQHYEQVSKAYMSTVHAVLAGEMRAPQAAAALEKQLVAITGFRARPPRSNDERQNTSQ